MSLLYTRMVEQISANDLRILWNEYIVDALHTIKEEIGWKSGHRKRGS